MILPEFLKNLALVLPPYHLAQLALKSLGADRGQPVIHHVAVLALFGVISLLVATVAYRRDDGRTYG
jgi:ABC-2 type transport system permease protein